MARGSAKLCSALSFGEKLDAEILEKVLASQSFNQGFTTSEYLAASIIDQAFHQLESQEIPLADDIMGFELSALEDAGLAISAVPPRYRATYFNHIMGGYSAGYYSYIWSEVLDADTVEWFKENGGLLRQNGDYFRESVLSRGGSLDAMQMYNNFRGRELKFVLFWNGGDCCRSFTPQNYLSMVSPLSSKTKIFISSHGFENEAPLIALSICKALSSILHI